MKKERIAIYALAGAILILLSFLSINRVAAQETTENTQTEEYCMVLATSNMLGTKVTITVDHGQAVKLFKNTGAVRDEEGKLKKFNTVIDALNYMNEDGWIFVDAYVVTVSSQNVYHYMMKRLVVQEK